MNIKEMGPFDPEETISNKKIFIWIDILGFSDALEYQEEYRKLSELLKTFQHIFINSKFNYHVHIISDGLLLEIQEDKDFGKLIEIFREIGNKQFQFIVENNRFIRGGIAVGTKYENIEKSNFFVGNGLSRAEKLESNDINWPVIGTNEDNLREMRGMFHKTRDGNFKLKEGFNQSGKRIYFIDFLVNDLDKQFFELLKDNIEKYNRKEDYKIRNKYIWLLKYYRQKAGRSSSDTLLEGIIL